MKLRSRVGSLARSVAVNGCRPRLSITKNRLKNSNKYWGGAEAASGGSRKRARTRLSVCCWCVWHRPKSIHVAIILLRPADMRSSLGCCIYLLAVALPVFALGDDVQLCPDATLLLPFVTSQIKQGMNLIVFQGTAVPQVWGLRFKFWGLGPDSLIICTHPHSVFLRCRRMERPNPGP